MNQKQSQALPGSKEKETSGGQRHNFTIQVSLDEMGGTRQVVINHVQSEEKKKWSGWKPGELIDFIALHAGVQAPKIATPEITEPAKQVPAIATAEAPPRTTTTPERVPLPAASDGLAGVLHLRNLEIVSVDANNPECVLRQGQPYSFRLTMNMIDVIAPDNIVLTSRAIVMAKQPGKPRQLAGQGRNTINLIDRSTTIDVAGGNLPPGVYLLDAQVTLTSDKAGSRHHQSFLEATLKGGSLEILER